MNIEILGTQHVKDAAAIITHSFVNYEPLVSNLQIPSTSFNRMCEVMVAEAASQSLSFVAIKNSQMVGAVLVRKANQPLIDKKRAIEICPQMEPIFQLLDKLETDSMEFSYLDKENLVYLDMGGCHPDWMGKGVANSLTAHAVQELALTKKLDMVAACTNKITQGMFTKQYQAFQLNKIVYNEFLYEGAHPFSKLSSSLMAQLLHIPQSHIKRKAV